MTPPQQYGDAAKRLIAFRNRYIRPDANRFASGPEASEEDIHNKLVYDLYERFDASTRKTFDGFCRRWVEFCESNNYGIFDTSAIRRCKYAEKQATLELAQRKDALKSRQMLWCNAQHSTLFTEALTAGSALPPDVQTGNTPSTPFIPLLGHPVPLSDPSAPVQCTALSRQPNKVANAHGNPEFFQSQTISGRYHEWIGDGQCSSIKNQLVMKKNGLGLPGTGHTKRAVDNLRKKRHLPEAIEQLVMQGLTGKAAIALVTKVMEDFGLRSISQQSTAFELLKRTVLAEAETKMLLGTGKTVLAFKRAYDEEKNKALSCQAT